MLPYLARRIANYAVLLFIATSLAYLLASASLDPSALWNRQDPSLNWDAIHANLVKYNISHDLWGAWCFSDWGSFSSRESIG